MSAVSNAVYTPIRTRKACLRADGVRGPIRSLGSDGPVVDPPSLFDASLNVEGHCNRKNAATTTPCPGFSRVHISHLTHAGPVGRHAWWQPHYLPDPLFACRPVVPFFTDISNRLPFPSSPSLHLFVNENIFRMYPDL